MAPEGSIVRRTLRALLEPRRLLPTLLVAAALLLLQWRSSNDPLAAPVGAAMCLAFILAAPLSWRVLFPEGIDLRHGALRVLLYGAIGVGVVLCVGKLLPDALAMKPTVMTAPSSLVVCVALFLVGGFGLGRDIGFEVSLAKERERGDALHREAEHAQLLALRAHLDPHFLFNTLNAIAELCRENGEVAEASVLKLSRILRAMLRGVRAPSWSLSQELELVRDLFALHLLRDPHRFALEWDVPAPVPDTSVPPMVLLPLAENAITHGPSKGHEGTVRVRVVVDGAALRVTIENPGPFAGPRAGGEGLSTTRRRLDLAYGREASLTVEERGDATGVVVRLPVGGVPVGVNA